MGNLWQFFVFFLTNFDSLINIYTRILTIINGVYFHTAKVLSYDDVNRNMLVSSLFPKKGELIYGREGIPSGLHTMINFL